MNPEINDDIKKKIQKIYHTVNNNISHYISHTIYNENISHTTYNENISHTTYNENISPTTYNENISPTICNENINHTTCNENINHTTYETNTMDKDTVSIIMTTHKRIKQTLFTLNTIQNSSYKNIQVILVDDSINCFIDDNTLKQFSFQIVYIKINSNTRDWINPCINYNIGFKFIKGSYVIIQNAEVCHVGDVIKHVKEHLTEGNYLVFNVLNTGSFKNNLILHSLYQNGKFLPALTKFQSYQFVKWYQHQTHRCHDYHFLVAITYNDFIKMGGFDYDFAMGRSYDDDEFIFRIKTVSKLNIVHVDYDLHQTMGIHQHHSKVKLNASSKEIIRTNKLNYSILEKKKKYFSENGNWLCSYNSI